MAKENVTLQEQELTVQAQESAATEREVEIVDTDVTFKLQRETFQHEGKTYNSFYIPIRVFGRDMKIQLAPKEGDRNAYTVLADIFTLYTEADLVCCEGVMSDGKKKTKFMTYLVKAQDPSSGLEVSVALKPVGDTNKRLLEQLYRQKSQYSPF